MNNDSYGFFGGGSGYGDLYGLDDRMLLVMLETDVLVDYERNMIASTLWSKGALKPGWPQEWVEAHYGVTITVDQYV